MDHIPLNSTKRSRIENVLLSSLLLLIYGCSSQPSQLLDSSVPPDCPEEPGELLKAEDILQEDRLVSVSG